MNTLETETSRGLREFQKNHDNFVYKRIMDAATQYRYKGTQRPGDFDCIYSGTPYLLECKSTKKPRFYLSQIREHQYDSMIEYMLAGAKTYFIISYRHTKGNIEYVALSIRDLITYYLDYLEEKGKVPKSFSYNELIERGSLPLTIEYDNARLRYIDFSKLITI